VFGDNNNNNNNNNKNKNNNNNKINLNFGAKTKDPCGHYYVNPFRFRDPIKVPCFKYHWGREDCPTSPDLKDINEFPGPSMKSQQMFDYFKREFDFGKDEVGLSIDPL
jgi:hypothetical protein